MGTRLRNRAPDKGRGYAKEREDRLVEEIDDIEGKDGADCRKADGSQR